MVVGKSTTIGKLAKWFKRDGYSLMLAAGDTFRAAAVAQLQAWGERNSYGDRTKGPNADAASVVYDALQAAKARSTEVLVADTAGRLHTQIGLMNELSKIRRVLGKLDSTAPHEVLMVIDGTTGQNALSQLRQFHAAAERHWSCGNQASMALPRAGQSSRWHVNLAFQIHFISVGEQLEDMHFFDPEAFVDALLPKTFRKMLAVSGHVFPHASPHIFGSCHSVPTHLACPLRRPAYMIALYAQRLLTWFDQYGRHHLPWQHPRTPYRV